MRYFFPTPSTRIATSLMGGSVFVAVVEVFDDFVLKADEAARVPPPIVAPVSGGIERKYANPHVVGEYAVQRPFHAAGGKYLRRHDDAARAQALRPFAQRDRLFVRVRQIDTEGLDVGF